MIKIRSLWKFPLSAKKIARHVEKGLTEQLRVDAEKLSNSPAEKISKLIKEVVKVLGRELKTHSSQNQAHLLNFVADLTGGSSIKSLHYLVDESKVAYDSVKDAFYTAVGTGHEQRVMSLLKAFPKLLFETFSENRAIYDQFSDKYWLDLLESGVINLDFLRSLKDPQVVTVLKKIPIYKPFFESPDIKTHIARREKIRKDLMLYFDELVLNKDSKALFIMQLVDMPLMSKDLKGRWRILQYCEAFACSLNMKQVLESLKKQPENAFVIELLSQIKVPQTLEHYELHFQIGKALSNHKGLRRKVLDHIADSKERKLQAQILDYCMDVFQNHKPLKGRSSH